MRDNIPPEEKLLRLIRGQRQKGSRPASFEAKAAESSILSRAGSRKENWPRGLADLIGYRFKRLLVAGVVISGVYFFSAIIYAFFGLRNIKLSSVAAPDRYSHSFDIPNNLIPLEVYLNNIRSKRIFVSEQYYQMGKPAVGVAMDALKDMNLVGIITGDNPQAIIEDKKNQKTYYVNKGQYIGEFLIEDILEGKVIISRNNERFELYL